MDDLKNMNETDKILFPEIQGTAFFRFEIEVRYIPYFACFDQSCIWSLLMVITNYYDHY